MVTILTPTYNRAHTLPRLFYSLLEQTTHDFEWLVVDDGSDDNTESIIDEFKKDSPFPVRYIKKNNGGKHTALNVGFIKADREWIFVLDSDDWLRNDCIDKIISELTSNDFNYNSLSFLRVYESGEVIGDPFPDGLNDFLDRELFKVKGDKAEVFNKSCLEGFCFPSYDGENFMAEAPLYIWYGQRFNTRFINYGGYICEYQSDGLSTNSIINRYKSLNSTLYVTEVKYKAHDDFPFKARAAINWWRFKSSRIAMKKEWRPPLVYLPIGMLLFLFDLVRGRRIPLSRV
ncbi:glycosyltransferase family 2 protein [Zobellella maritima]|uniref:glycosyltransferase family 2 protein n=1 Tax=Zobellella maritima TaxID=2059725 RepID=UPI000E30755E|nr:glycosyltransferase family A protein [Zobellella maritima]